MPWICIKRQSKVLNRAGMINQFSTQFSVLIKATYRSYSVYDDVSHLHPALQWQHLKQSQHCVAHIIKIKVSRVCPKKSSSRDIWHFYLCLFLGRKNVTPKSKVKYKSLSYNIKHVFIFLFSIVTFSWAHLLSPCSPILSNFLLWKKNLIITYYLKCKV